MRRLAAESRGLAGEAGFPGIFARNSSSPRSPTVVSVYAGYVTTETSNKCTLIRVRGDHVIFGGPFVLDDREGEAHLIDVASAEG